MRTTCLHCAIRLAVLDFFEEEGCVEADGTIAVDADRATMAMAVLIGEALAVLTDTQERFEKHLMLHKLILSTIDDANEQAAKLARAH